MERQKILIVVGPTASGKSALAVALAQKINGEVISADSRQVYRGLDIGTAKITERQMHGVRHHLLNVASARDSFSADDFLRHAQKGIADISMRSKIPIVAGGTGFYIDALTGRITLTDVEPDAELRRKLSKKTAAQLYVLLKKKDSRRAAAMDTPSERNNKVRLIRALEIAAARTKKQQTMRVAKDGPSYDILWIGIAPDLHELDRQIEERLRARIRHGMIAEAMHLHAKGLSYKRMLELGLEYRYLALFLQKKISRQELETQLYSAIRRYARKQIGYWKRNKEIVWFRPKQSVDIAKLVKVWLMDSTTIRRNKKACKAR
ncbi:MAG TPA: tRNA (adenosine(37)-N6)-dimethylallyltransferase MiaA [Candidatus Paceibacterota bacterium]|nr:tRNA (adenosine(37)-N6)-dimethylallyltransferase MiaA [Candidatus Paceibacterota bacterium]